MEKNVAIPIELLSFQSLQLYGLGKVVVEMLFDKPYVYIRQIHITPDDEKEIHLLFTFAIPTDRKSHGH